MEVAGFVMKKWNVGLKPFDKILPFELFKVLSVVTGDQDTFCKLQICDFKTHVFNDSDHVLHFHRVLCQVDRDIFDGVINHLPNGFLGVVHVIEPYILLPRWLK